MNRRNFFKMFGGAIAAAMLPLGALALIESKPKRFEGFVDVPWSGNLNMALEDFEERILGPAMRQMAINVDHEITRLLK
jgi:hypothetical protein